MNFMFEWQEKNLTGERSKRVMTAFFCNFPKIFDHFAKISENYIKLALSERHTNVADHILKTVEDY